MVNDHVVGQQALDRQALHPPVAADEGFHERARRSAEDVGRGGVLVQHPALGQHDDPIGQPHRLVEVVGHEHHRRAELALDPPQLGLQVGPGHRIKGAERLVHQQHRRIGRQRPGHAHPLLLAAGELVGVAAPERRRVEVHQRQELVDPGPDAGLRPAQQLRDGADVGGDVLVGEEADLLDHVADGAAQLHRRPAGHVLAGDRDAAARRFHQPVDHPQRGRLAAT
jgi:hypothetical protein